MYFVFSISFWISVYTFFLLFLWERTSFSQMINKITFFCDIFFFHFSFGVREERLWRIVRSSHMTKVLLGHWCWFYSSVRIATLFSPVKISSRRLNLLYSSKNMYRTFYTKRNLILMNSYCISWRVVTELKRWWDWQIKMSLDNLNAPLKWIQLKQFFRICFNFFPCADIVIVSFLRKGCSECFIQGLVGVVGCAKDCFGSRCTSKWWFEPGDGIHGLWNRYHCDCWCLQLPNRFFKTKFHPSKTACKFERLLKLLYWTYC